MDIKSINQDENIILVCDGSCHPNPGVVGYAYIMYVKGKAYRATASKYGYGTNNIGEYASVSSGLEDVFDMVYNRAKEALAVKNVYVFCDSELIINQINGIYRIKDPILKEFYDNIRRIEKDIVIPVVYQRDNKITSAAHNLIEPLYQLPSLNEMMESKEEKPPEEGKLLSSCCGEEAFVASEGTTHYYICSGCRRPCDLKEKK